ncbi:hypothetical protein Pelo_11232 [Pelomyxa schiedti]|nr:hypothetical protein Pelo_11232 [Pelomyxa schiedti]
MGGFRATPATVFMCGLLWIMCYWAVFKPADRPDPLRAPFAPLWESPAPDVEAESSAPVGVSCGSSHTSGSRVRPPAASVAFDSVHPCCASSLLADSQYPLSSQDSVLEAVPAPTTDEATLYRCSGGASDSGKCCESCGCGKADVGSYKEVAANELRANRRSTSTSVQGCGATAAFDGWAMLHVVLYFTQGVLFPGHMRALTVCGIFWEVLEATSRNFEVQHKLRQLRYNLTSAKWMGYNPECSYWYGRISDLAFNAVGLVLGEVVHDLVCANQALSANGDTPKPHHSKKKCL